MERLRQLTSMTTTQAKELTDAINGGCSRENGNTLIPGESHVNLYLDMVSTRCQRCPFTLTSAGAWTSDQKRTMAAEINTALARVSGASKKQRASYQQCKILECLHTPAEWSGFKSKAMLVASLGCKPPYDLDPL